MFRNLNSLLPKNQLQWIVYSPSEIRPSVRGSCIYALAMPAEQQGFVVRYLTDTCTLKSELFSLFEKLSADNYHVVIWLGVNSRAIKEVITRTSNRIPNLEDISGPINYNARCIYTALKIFSSSRLEIDNLEPNAGALFEGRIID